jgi:PTH1 family peptidyl-tRNA hydrolase
MGKKMRAGLLWVKRLIGGHKKESERHDSNGSGLRLIAGLGNPGPDYACSRHNIGFRVLDRISKDFEIPVARRRYKVSHGRGNLKGLGVLLAKPMAYMNRSGPPLAKIARRYRIFSEEILVIHDDLDLAFGRLKIKEKGGHGGHNGLRSLIDALGTDRFIRIRMGIGRPEPGTTVTDHVLSPFTEAEVPLLDSITASARDAAVTILCEGAGVGMNLFNSTRITISR